MPNPNPELAAKIRESMTTDEDLVAAVQNFGGLKRDDAISRIATTVDAWAAGTKAPGDPIGSAIWTTIETVRKKIEEQSR